MPPRSPNIIYLVFFFFYLVYVMKTVSLCKFLTFHTGARACVTVCNIVSSPGSGLGTMLRLMHPPTRKLVQLSWKNVGPLVATLWPRDSIVAYKTIATRSASSTNRCREARGKNTDTDTGKSKRWAAVHPPQFPSLPSTWLRSPSSGCNASAVCHYVTFFVHFNAVCWAWW